MGFLLSCPITIGNLAVPASVLLWYLAYAIFLVRYTPILFAPRQDVE